MIIKLEVGTISLAKKTMLFGMDWCSDGWMNQWMDDEWMNQKGVCRTAAATPGLLIKDITFVIGPCVSLLNLASIIIFRNIHINVEYLKPDFLIQ